MVKEDIMNYSKRFKYYQPNDKDLKDKTGDCQIRALCKALGLTWTEAFDLTIPLCRELQTYTIFDGNLAKTKEAMSQLGFSYTGISNKKGTRRPTVDSFAKDHPEGTFICSVAHHVVTVVDGFYYDTWDSGRCCLYGFYELKENKTLGKSDRSFWKVGCETGGKWYYEETDSKEIMMSMVAEKSLHSQKISVRSIKRFAL